MSESESKEQVFDIIVDNDRSGITIKRCVHRMWAMREKLRGLAARSYRQYPYDSPYDRPIIGKWQYVIESNRGIISIVELPDYFMDGVTLWEMYCMEGNLFEGERRFMTYVDAEIEARRYLEL